MTTTLAAVDRPSASCLAARGWRVAPLEGARVHWLDVLRFARRRRPRFDGRCELQAMPALPSLHNAGARSMSVMSVGPRGPTEGPAGRELDALVAERVMGLRVVGQMCAIFVEGEWSLHPDSEPTGWACYAGIEPVYARAECDCAVPVVREYESAEKAGLYRDIDADRDERQAASIAKTGHRTYCLRVIPEYSTNIADAWQVVEKLQSDWAATIENDGAGWWEATFWAGDTRHVMAAGSAPLAICWAALLASPTERTA